jgi:hypothetical protein
MLGGLLSGHPCPGGWINESGHFEYRSKNPAARRFIPALAIMPKTERERNGWPTRFRESAARPSENKPDAPVFHRGVNLQTSEAAMKAMLLTSALAVAVIGTATIGAAPAQAQNYPWCAYYAMGNDGGGTNCGFVTYEQCMTTLSGMGGFCEPNTQYRAPVGPSGAYRARARAHGHRS